VVEKQSWVACFVGTRRLEHDQALLCGLVLSWTRSGGKPCICYTSIMQGAGLWFPFYAVHNAGHTFSDGPHFDHTRWLEPPSQEASQAAAGPTRWGSAGCECDAEQGRGLDNSAASNHSCDEGAPVCFWLPTQAWTSHGWPSVRAPAAVWA
jgi:hypothetical protein